jgi:hypothetical protein
MIYILDNFLDDNALENKLNELLDNQFDEYIAGGKSFYSQIPDNKFDEYVINLIEKQEKKNVTNIFSFFRISTDELDTDWRIHSDLSIMGCRPDRAAVLYMTPKRMDKLNGTAFWEHEFYGKELPNYVDNEEYDRVLLKDSNDLSKWTLNSVIGYEQNRLVSYPANYFHSKYPNKSHKDGRIIYVIFYKVN